MLTKCLPASRTLVFIVRYSSPAVLSLLEGQLLSVQFLQEAGTDFFRNISVPHQCQKATTPDKSAFHKRKGQISHFQTMSHLRSQGLTQLTGSGMQTGLRRKVWHLARKKRMPSLSMHTRLSHRWGFVALFTMHSEGADTRRDIAAGNE